MAIYIQLPEVAGISGYCKDTLHIWKNRYLKHGYAELLDKLKAPLLHPNEYSENIKEKIRFLRKEGLEKKHCAVSKSLKLPKS